MARLPTKEDIRQKYGITEQDFAVLESLPSADTLLQEKAYVENKGLWGDFEVWCKKSIGQKIVYAFIFLGAVGTGVDYFDKGAIFIYANTPQIAYYESHLSDYTKGPAIGFLEHTANPLPSHHTPTLDTSSPILHSFSTGTQLFPVSGSWPPV